MTKAKEHSIAYFIKGSPCDNFNIAKYGKDHCLYRVSAFNQQIKETQPHLKNPASIEVSDKTPADFM